MCVSPVAKLPSVVKVRRRRILPRQEHREKLNSKSIALEPSRPGSFVRAHRVHRPTRACANLFMKMTRLRTDEELCGALFFASAHPGVCVTACQERSRAIGVMFHSAQEREAGTVCKLLLVAQVKFRPTDRGYAPAADCLREQPRFLHDRAK